MLLFAMLMVTACGGGEDIPSVDKPNEPAVKVEPVWNFTKPCLEWGKSKDYIKQYMKGFELLHENEYMLVYLGNQKTEACIGYKFKNNKLYMTGVDIPESLVTDKKKRENDTFKGFVVNSAYASMYVNEGTETFGQFSHHIWNDKYPFYTCAWMHGVLQKAE